MNTVSLIISIIVFIAVVIGIYKLFRLRKDIDDPITRTMNTITITTLIVVLVLSIIATLNLYGYGRLPLLKEMARKIPESYSVPNLMKPPVNGSTQPSSKPSFDEHKEQMEKLKRDGL